MTEPAEKIYDQTYLRENRDGYRPHRDYAAHYFRWGWATSRTGVSIAGRSTLDIGCGPDLPLINVATYKSQVPSSYVGIDLNPLGKKLTAAQSERITLYGKTDFTEPATWQMLLERHGKFDRIVSFECIEHMPKDRGWQLLWGARQLLADDGEFYLSTPVLDKKPAHNHVHEYGVDELAKLVEAAGFRVINRFGTFANIADSKVGLRKWLEDKDYDPLAADEILDALAEYYSPDVLATFVAPLIPDHSRNNLWRLELKRD
jgi:SAM-dependent methyltransferase